MKTTINFLLILVIFTTKIVAQSVLITPGSQGNISVPKLTFDQISAIPNPQEGMVAYDQSFKCLRVYNGSKWVCSNENLFNNSQAFAWSVPVNDINGITPLVRIALDKDKNVYVFGMFANRIAFGIDTLKTNLPFIRDYFLAKFSANGTYQWAKQLRTNDVNEIATLQTDLSVDAMGNVYLISQFGGTMNINNVNIATASNSSGDIFLAKFNTDGNLRWFKNYTSSTATASLRGEAITLDGKGNLYFAGNFASNITIEGHTLSSLGTGSNPRDAFVSKMDTAGTFLWIKQINNTAIKSIKTDTSGNNLVITGQFDANITTLGGANNLSLIGGTDILLVKLNTPNGNAIWARKAGGVGTGTTTPEFGKSLAIEPNGNIYLMANYGSVFTLGSVTTQISNINGFVGVLIAKYDAAGNVIWVNTIKANTNSTLTNMQGSGGIDFDKDGYLWLTENCRDATGFLMTATGGSHNPIINGPFYVKIATEGSVIKINAIANGTINSSLSFNIKSDGIGGAFVCGRYRDIPINIGISSLPISFWSFLPGIGETFGVDLFIARVN